MNVAPSSPDSRTAPLAGKVPPVLDRAVRAIVARRGISVQTAINEALVAWVAEDVEQHTMKKGTL